MSSGTIVSTILIEQKKKEMFLKYPEMQTIMVIANVLDTFSTCLIFQKHEFKTGVSKKNCASGLPIGRAFG